jgi:acylphosphatase
MIVDVERSVRVVVTGRVQGVWFRAWTVREAGARGLHGWVRNCRDGTVEAVFAGTVSGVEDMIEACHAGPPHARVSAVRVEPAETPSRAGFHLAATE